MRKPQNPLMLLPEDQQAQIAEWMLGGMNYREVNLLVEKEFGLPHTSQFGRYQSFWAEVCAPIMKSRRKKFSGLADERAEEAKKNPAQFEAATLDAIQQRAYELAEDAKAKPNDVRAILSLLLKAKDQDFSREKFTAETELQKQQLALDRERLDLVKRKADAYDRAQAALTAAKDYKGGITQETLTKIERELKLL